MPEFDLEEVKIRKENYERHGNKENISDIIRE